jgi:tetratricopeptide (TPR) repeat protein
MDTNKDNHLNPYLPLLYFNIKYSCTNSGNPIKYNRETGVMIDKQDLIKDLFEGGKALFNSGDLPRARNLFEQVITILPGHIQSLKYLGFICKKQGDFMGAIEKFNLILLQEESAEVFENTGICLLQLGEAEKAGSYFNRAILLNPASAAAYANLGSVMQLQGKNEEAVLNYRKFLNLVPANPDIYNNIGLALEAMGKHREAESNFRQAAGLAPERANFINNLALSLQIQGKHQEATGLFQKAIELDPADPDFYNNLGFSWQSLEHYEKAAENYRQAALVYPENPEFFSNLGSALEAQGNYAEAITSYEKAIRLAPDNKKYYYNLAISQEKTGDYTRAMNNYLQAIRLKPDYADAHWNLSLLLLLNGEYKIGWKEYEWRFLAESAEDMSDSRPRWDGSDPGGKTIFIRHEQGFGDTIQFFRFLPLVQEKGARVILECPSELKRLFETVQGYDLLVEKNLTPVPEHDFYLPLLSLPHFLNTTLETVPASVPYISVGGGPEKNWCSELNKINGFKAGIVWAANPQNRNYTRRSCPLSFFDELAGKLNLKFFSLQKGDAALQLKTLPAQERIIDLSGFINDFADTAAIINSLDLVITVDTAVAHLAGALARPVWTLIHFNPDWRWLLNRNDTPWYPTMELFRQPVPGDWDSVFQAVENRLKLMISH